MALSSGLVGRLRAVLPPVDVLKQLKEVAVKEFDNMVEGEQVRFAIFRESVYRRFGVNSKYLVCLRYRVYRWAANPLGVNRIEDELERYYGRATDFSNVHICR